MQTGTVDTSIENGIATVTFFHPQSNSLPGALLKNLAQTIFEAGEDANISVIILRSIGDKAFCAGASFDELISIKSLDEGKEFFSGFAHVINAMRLAPSFIIGRVHNKTVGGGVGLASAVDYCMATTNASVKLSELAVGIGPFVVGPAVERKMGVSAMSHLAINATEWQNAQWAKEHGLYNEIFETETELDLAVNSLAQKLATSNPDAMREMKKSFWRGTENWDSLLLERAAISGKLVLSDFTRNAISKFKKK
ncbi:MAG: enoyl-CoA hydratase/isomerase family protein [Flavobacteriales bacterium]|nr:enoyl-CoA hydratase/isomerase family protein [Flavobacteriales bacterium]